jgi:transcriptional regulator with XRE-family HTH domain
VPAGQKLKKLRNRRNITVREVEQASRRIAEVKGDKRFCISNGWLAQLENGVSEPSICKLFSLSVIYRANFLELLRLYNVDVNDKEKYEPVAEPYLTQLISHNGDGLAPAENSTAQGQSDTTLLNAKQFPRAEESPNVIYAHLGLADFTMYPMIRPGALLKIDTSQNKLQTNGWHNEYERPIYFIELRQEYACGWCELQGDQLLIIPHHSSPAIVRRFTYAREAEIVGRVIGYNTPCVGLDSYAEVRKMKVMPAKSI